jgi:hypothetical protein
MFAILACAINVQKKFCGVPWVREKVQEGKQQT